MTYCDTRSLRHSLFLIGQMVNVLCSKQIVSSEEDMLVCGGHDHGQNWRKKKKKLELLDL